VTFFSLRKGFDTLVWLVAWWLWKERNRQVYEQAALQPVALTPAILEEEGCGHKRVLLPSYFSHQHGSDFFSRAFVRIFVCTLC
jgi:hypothetical protein